MNLLKTFTLTAARPDMFDVYWTNSDHRPGGLLEVRIRPDIPDRQIAAELSAIQHLLEDKLVLGNTISNGKGIKLVVSQGAIRKLSLRRSDKSHLAPYANFLTTRFAGCTMEVCKKQDWFGDSPDTARLSLTVNGPRRETVTLGCLGEVAVSSHVLERLAQHLLPDAEPDQRINQAWKRLLRIASDPVVTEVTRRNRNAPLRHARPGHCEGRYFLNRMHNLIFVVTDQPYKGRTLVTTYPATKEFVASSTQHKVSRCQTC